MGNVNGHAGPLPDSWMNQQFELALKILKREREYGMKPVLPAFNGYVPPQLKTVYPSSKITQLAPWAGFVGTFHLSHEDPLFQQIGVSYAKKVVEAFGTDHLFNVDPFNEEVPPSSDPTYLAGVSKALYGPLVAADPQAIWVMQGWFLSFESSFWGPEQTKAVFNAIPSDRLIILDLFAEEYPMWNVTKTFYNHQFIWNLLHNFGERPGMFGGLNETYRKLTAAMQGGGKLFRGMGLTMEGIHQNPVVYDYATDMIWKNQGSDLSWWISQYIKRRYERVEDSVASAWTILLNSIYNLDSNNVR
jgi:alpha-N-acetylglucosaminidase